MKKCILFLSLAICATLLTTASRASEGVGMVTGSATGTYIQIGKDIARVCAKYGLNIVVKASEGSLKNIQRMNSRENAAFGIVQSDVLGILYANQPEVAKHLRMVYPLYNEEVHILARKNILKFRDLQGKKVATGTKGSGNWLTLANLLHTMHTKLREKITDMKPLDAVIAVLEGKIDAMIYVSGKPVKLFRKLEQLENNPKFARLMKDVHFVPLRDPEMLEQYYVASEIGPSDYGWLSDTVPTIAVKALLVSFDFSRKNTPYYQNRCATLKTMAKAIRENMDDLRRSGHPKWLTVNLDASVGRWQRDTCAHPGATAATSDDLYDALHDLFEE
jgi:TRAP transporter TAXI family solute receptor